MFLQIKKIPRLSWSSKSPRNLKPSFKTLFLLCFGLIIFGFGEGLLIISTIGASPWNVLHQGLALNLGLSVGTWAVSYTHLRAHETDSYLVCRFLLEKNFFNDTATTEIYT